MIITNLWKVSRSINKSLWNLIKHHFAKLRDILNYWGRYLKSEASTYVLNTSSQGWLGEEALKRMAEKAYGDDFQKVFKCNHELVEGQQEHQQVSLESHQTSFEQDSKCNDHFQLISLHENNTSH